MRKYLIEFIGTFFLVLTIALTVASGSPVAPVAIGVMLMAMVYMGGHVSGAHYNPAVTLAVWVRGKCATGDVVPYVLAQLLAAVAASLVAQRFTGQVFFAKPGADVSMAAAIIAEVIFTFALVSVILNVATHKQTSGNSYYGVAIGFTVAASAVAIGPVSGSALNPAVGAGTALYGLIAGAAPASNLLLIYTVGPVVGGLLGAVVFKITAGPEAD